MLLNSTTSKLYLLPNSLSCRSQNHWQSVIPQKIRDITINIDLIFAETPKIARSLLKELGRTKPIQNVSLYPLSAETNEDTLKHYLHLIKKEKIAGILSDAGCAAIADPGARLIQKAHANSIQVVPLVGPSAILLALIASGLNGQKFSFSGYLPKELNAREKTICKLQKRSAYDNETQIFIETPYRNEALFESLLSNLSSTTILSIAIDLTMDTENIYTHTVEEWREKNKQEKRPELKNRQAIFLFLSQAENLK